MGSDVKQSRQSPATGAGCAAGDALCPGCSQVKDVQVLAIACRQHLYSSNKPEPYHASKEADTLQHASTCSSASAVQAKTQINTAMLIGRHIADDGCLAWLPPGVKEACQMGRSSSMTVCSRSLCRPSTCRQAQQ